MQISTRTCLCHPGISQHLMSMSVPCCKCTVWDFLHFFFEAVISSGWVVIHKWLHSTVNVTEIVGGNLMISLNFAVHLEPEREQTLDKWLQRGEWSWNWPRFQHWTAPKSQSPIIQPQKQREKNLVVWRYWMWRLFWSLSPWNIPARWIPGSPKP